MAEIHTARIRLTCNKQYGDIQLLYISVLNSYILPLLNQTPIIEPRPHYYEGIIRCRKTWTTKLLFI